MIERPAPSADFLDRPPVRSVLRSRPTSAYLGARRGPVGYAVLVVVAIAAAIEGARLSPWLGVALALVPAQALVDWLVSWYRVGSFAYHDAVERRPDDEPDGPPGR